MKKTKTEFGRGADTIPPSPVYSRKKGVTLSATIAGIFYPNPVSAESIKKIVEESQKEHLEVKNLLKEGKRIEEECRTFHMGAKT